VHDPLICAQAATISVFVFRPDGGLVCYWPPSEANNECPVQMKVRSGDLFGRRVGISVSRDVSVDRHGITLPKGKYLVQAHVDVESLCGASAPAVDSTRRLRDPKWWVERKDVSISGPLLGSVTDDASAIRHADEDQVIPVAVESDITRALMPTMVKAAVPSPIHGGGAVVVNGRIVATNGKRVLGAQVLFVNDSRKTRSIYLSVDANPCSSGTHLVCQYFARMNYLSPILLTSVRSQGLIGYAGLRTGDRFLAMGVLARHCQHVCMVRSTSLGMFPLFTLWCSTLLWQLLKTQSQSSL